MESVNPNSWGSLAGPEAPVDQVDERTMMSERGVGGMGHYDYGLDLDMESPRRVTAANCERPLSAQVAERAMYAGGTVVEHA